MYPPQLIAGQVEVLEGVLEAPEGVWRDVLEAGVGDLEVDDLEVLEEEVGESLDGGVVDVEELDDDALRVRLHRRHQQRELSSWRERRDLIREFCPFSQIFNPIFGLFI